jgi:hypothetical protein
MMDLTNYAIQFAVTGAAMYLLGVTDTTMIMQAGAISVMSAVVADMSMPYITFWQ